MGRIKELDGLRAIAALLVIAWHYIGIPDGPHTWFYKVSYLGHFGVDLFFVLSGYLITTILLQNRESPSYFVSFYMRRAFRIWPIYYPMVLVCFLGWRFGGNPALFSGDLPGWTYLLGIQNFWMARENQYGVFWLSGTWSLAIEEQFYLFFPVIVRFISLPMLPKILWAIIIVCPIGRFFDSFTKDEFGYYVLPYFRADVLAIGALIAWWRFTGQTGGVSEKAQRLLFWSSCAIPLVIVAGSRTFHAAAWQHTLAAWFFGAVVFKVLENQGAASLSILRSDTAEHFAKWSFASYMFHHWVAYLIFSWSGVTRTMTTWSGVGMTAVAFVATFVLCAISYKFFERPLIQYSHQRYAFSRKIPSLRTSPAE
jgi:peptidoglycan/LPS O-acetylase OafA/YrhL